MSLPFHQVKHFCKIFKAFQKKIKKKSFFLVWLEVVERTSKFLRSVVMGDVLNQESASSEVEIPAKDRNTALTLLLEFAIQKGKSIFFSFYSAYFFFNDEFLCVWYTRLKYTIKRKKNFANNDNH